MISEKEKDSIRKEAKQILDNFASALEGVKVKKRGFKKRVGGYRKERDGQKCDEDFRNRMFDNAPSKDGDCIIAEKKKWQ